MSDLILRPGADPPLVIPYCRSCDMPVEGFCMDVVTSPYYVGIHARCHGQTSSARFSVDEVFEAKRHNRKLYVIVPKGMSQGAREQKSRGMLRAV